MARRCMGIGNLKATFPEAVAAPHSFAVRHRQQQKAIEPLPADLLMLGAGRKVVCKHRHNLSIMQDFVPFDGKRGF